MSISRAICWLVSVGRHVLTYMFVLSQDADHKAGGRVLEFLDSFALRRYNSNHGKVSNDIFSKRKIITLCWVVTHILLVHDMWL